MARSDVEIRMKCAKYMVMCITVVFWLSYAIVISLGRAINAVYHKIWAFLEDDFFLSTILVIVIGITMLAVTIFGCISVLNESSCLVNSFAVILSIVLVVEIATVAVSYSLRSQVTCIVEHRMRTTMLYYDRDSDLKNAFDFVQNKLNCCGVDSFKDWRDSPLSQPGAAGITIENITVPHSCCAKYHSEVVGNVETNVCVNIHKDGCLLSLSSLVHRSAALVCAGALTICVIQIIGIAFSFSLASRLQLCR